MKMSGQVGTVTKGVTKVKPNAFYCFMSKRKRELEGIGFHFPEGLKQVAMHVSEEWKKLGTKDKEKFKSEATEIRRRQKGEKDAAKEDQVLQMSQEAIKYELDLGFIANCPQAPLCVQFTDTLNGPARSQEMLKLIWQTPEASARISIVIFMNHYVKYGSTSIPCEIAMVAFNLANGLKDAYWSLVDPGRIPLGHGVEALKNGTRIGVKQPVSSNLTQVVESIEKMIEAYPNALIFAPWSRHRHIQAGMSWLFRQAGKEFDCRLYPFEQLLVAMSTAHLVKGIGPYTGKQELEKEDWRIKQLTKKKNRVAGHQDHNILVALCGVFLTANLAQDYLDTTMEYLYLEELACEHHCQSEEEDEKACNGMIHCALLNAKRLVFLGLDAVLMNYKDIAARRGKHFPQSMRDV